MGKVLIRHLSVSLLAVTASRFEAADAWQLQVLQVLQVAWSQLTPDLTVT